MLSKKLIIILLIALPATVFSADNSGSANPDEQEKTLSGMSIVGNDEAPKSLYIVPWKSSEIGVETGLERLDDKNARPVDREVFQRQLDFYRISHTNSVRR